VTTVNPKPRLQTAARTIDLLLAVAREPAGASVKDIVGAMGVPRQVVYNLLHTMLELRVIRRTPQQRYTLGVGLLPIVTSFERDLAIHDQLRPIVQSIARQTGETAYAVGWLDDEIVVLETARGAQPVHVAEVSLGYSGFAHARASGKLLLACASDEQRRYYMSKRPLDPRTEHTIVSESVLEEEFARIRRDGFASEIEEFLPGLCCIAVPVPHTNEMLCVGISAPIDRFTLESERYRTEIIDILSHAE